MQNILIIGATSAIAQATARRYAAEKASFCLIARNAEKLEILKQDLTARGAISVETISARLEDLTEVPSLLETAFAKLPTYDIVLMAHGTLPDQGECQQSLEKTLEAININGLSHIALLTEIANRMAKQCNGTIAVITSVAGDRGRQSNYVYGTAKGMVSTFLQGLRNRLHSAGVHVVDIKPGFVDTPMTAEFKKGALWSSPDKVAEDIVKAIQKDRSVVYTPFFWRLIMHVIRMIPEFIFKRLRL